MFGPVFVVALSVWSCLCGGTKCLVLCLLWHQVFGPVFVVALSVWSCVCGGTECLVLCLLLH